MIELLLGDCRDRLKELSDNSIDSIVTDPPYELGFMGKSWDASGVAYDVTVWQECLRVLKHGGHLLSFGGSRTYHRMACAIEDAGFQIRDQIMWVYGSGFPKSLNISKAIDKAAGAEREVVGSKLGQAGYHLQGHSSSTGAFSHGLGSSTPETRLASSLVTASATAEAEEWDGWGTALKPAHEPIVLARKPLVGTVANNVLTHGVGGINIDGCRVISDDWDEKTVLAKYTGNNLGNNSVTGNFGVTKIKSTNTESTLIGRFPANFIHDGSDEVLQLFPETKTGSTKPHKNISQAEYNQMNSKEYTGFHIGDSGSAARFFYCAKASKKDRNEGLDGFDAKFSPTMNNGIGGKEHDPDTATKKLNHHPTVKPTELMRYLCRLITPPNGTVLDPFTGSGSTGKAAVLEGFNFIGIEQLAEYIEIAKARIESVTK
jgi:site-specific DNA-methyltransferase (adenine-specific)